MDCVFRLEMRSASRLSTPTLAKVFWGGRSLYISGGNFLLVAASVLN